MFEYFFEIFLLNPTQKHSLLFNSFRLKLKKKNIKTDLTYNSKIDRTIEVWKIDIDGEKYG